ncbi:hypothetical protein [Ferrimonas balearica]|uniref:hypothetical protein n=1 Tax=Ferrimonas balearica TaxID=44012 RepID=UPI001F30DE83|nr:hypothetical protein [Ferrimonas balearica]MBY6019144.1 hypothetical protein [Halomonas denitrificans]MBY6095747.1 hypothetical protein [Ferrimonas balearica]
MTIIQWLFCQGQEVAGMAEVPVRWHQGGAMKKAVLPWIIFGLSGCAAAPQITETETTATISITTGALESNAIYVDETVFVRVFTAGQDRITERPVSVTVLKPDQTSAAFHLLADTRYDLQVFSVNSGPVSSSSCKVLLSLTTEARAEYALQFLVNDTTVADKPCLVRFSRGDNVLLERHMEKAVQYSVPIPIPIGL